MRVITNIGDSLIEVAGKVFRPNVPELILETWLRDHGHEFPPGQFYSREAQLGDVYPTGIVYEARLDAADITAVTVNFRTLDLIRQAIETFRIFYPTVPLVVTDNGSDDDSTNYIAGLSAHDLNVEVSLLARNEGHGPPLHRMISQARTPFVFAFDSDVVFHHGGFLELMKTRLVEQGLYAIGPIWHRDIARQLYYCSAVAALFDVEKYKSLPPFVYGPDIAVENMIEAKARGLLVEDFHVSNYLTHLEAGTRAAYGMRWDLAGA